MKRSSLMRTLDIVVVLALPVLLLVGIHSARATEPRAPEATAAPDEQKLARGKYLVTVAGCNDCHTPWNMGPKGPEPDMSRMLSGHPQSAQLPPAPHLPEGP